MSIQPKSIRDIINEDPGLSEPVTYEEFVRRQGQAGNIDDSTIEEAYAAYCKIINGEAADNGQQ